MGMYSVKSAYIAIQEEKFQSHTADNSGFWRRMWNFKIPAKVKNFLWRATSNFLLTKDLLRSRRVEVNPLCPVCNEESETILHSLVTCSFATVCHWTVSSAANTDENITFKEWMQLLCNDRNEFEVQNHAMICWQLWKNRNDIVWNQHDIDSLELVNSAYSVLNQWRFVQHNTFDRF